MNRSTSLAGVLLILTGAGQAAPEKATVSDFQSSNLSPVPTDAAAAARLKCVSAELRALFRKKRLFTVVSADPARAEVAKSADLRRCFGCADAMARTLSADGAITDEIQKA